MTTTLPSHIYGYENPDLVRVIVEKTERLRPESIATETHPVSRLVTTTALRKAREVCGPEHELCVLDFGGGAGLHYCVAKHELGWRLRWAVVETEPMCKEAARLENEELRFFPSIAAAREWLGHPDVTHTQGAIQFVPQPEEAVTELVNVGAYILAYGRMQLGQKRTRQNELSRLSENGPGNYRIEGVDPMVMYPSTTIIEADFMNRHEPWYELKLADRNGPGGQCAFIFRRRVN